MAATGQADNLAIGCWIWGFLACFIAVAGFPKVASDARLLVGSLSLGLPALAVSAGFLVRQGHNVLAVIALVLSSATPTYFFYAVNLIPVALAVAMSVLALRNRFGAKELPE